MEHSNPDWTLTSDDMNPARTIDHLKNSIISYCNFRKYEVIDCPKDTEKKVFIIKKKAVLIKYKISVLNNYLNFKHQMFGYLMKVMDLLR